MKIDAETGWFKGVGDIVCYAWIGQGIRAQGGDVTFYCNGWRQELFEVLGMTTTTDQTGAVVTHEGYETAVQNKSPLNYLEWIHAKLMEAACSGGCRTAGERGEGAPAPLAAAAAVIALIRLRALPASCILAAARNIRAKSICRLPSSSSTMRSKSVMALA
jgi:hypothetical protein